ncbi:hypothetical protein PI124_g21021 [Phytophthora idaei]|nr:hypothetical protein PI125_g24984 [Phytophthora idaei]KAG3125083.1 hypothetical protein PI126_g22933 [Phytophthora idaei]KAG3233912.1 hypothetical protein PI124_g21021 [Phytophthora idaei]
MQGMAGWLGRLEEPQTNMRQKLNEDKMRPRDVDQPMSPPMNSSLFASDFGRGSQLHLDSLGISPTTPLTTTPRRLAAAPQYFGQQKSGYGMPMSELQRVYVAIQAGQGHGPAGPALPPQGAQPQAWEGNYRFRARMVWLSGTDARQKKLATRLFDGSKNYVTLGLGFLE